MTTSIRKPGQSHIEIPVPPKVPDAMDPNDVVRPLIGLEGGIMDEPAPERSVSPGENPFHVPGTAPQANLPVPASGTGSEVFSAKVATAETSATAPAAPAPAAASVIHGDANDNELGNPDSVTPLTIYGGDGYDTLWGGTDADNLHGDVDNDSLIGGGGNDTLDGGADYDIVSYWQETGGAGIVANVSDAAWTYGGVTYQAHTGTDTWGTLDTYIDIESLVGSTQGDVIYAGNSASGWYLDGDAGDDTLTGGGNDDTLIGGSGNDTLVNGTVVYLGSDAINANLATGRVSGQGQDTLTNVTELIGSEGNDTIYGGKFASTIDGSLGNDVLYAGASTTILATMGSDTVHGGMGPNGTFAQPSTNRITGNWSTTLTYEDLSSTKGAIKADLGNGWVDEYYNGARNATDTIFKISSLIGSNGNDTIFGGAQNNTILGGGGNDYIVGFGGNDSLVGGDGNDTLSGSDGYRDTLVGGLGDDYYITGDSNDVIVDVGGIDTIETYFSSYTLQADIENLVLKAYSGTLVGNGLDNKLNASYGNDTLDGGAGNDTMAGGDGNDVYYIRDLGDVAIELNGATGGDDTVIVSVKNYDGTKLANIEHIQLVGEGSIAGINQAPAIGGITSPVTLTVNDNAVVSPFTSITITDADSATVTATVTMNHGYGSFTNLSIGSYDPQWLRYTVTGTVAQVQQALHDLVYDPTDRPNDAVGSSLTTAFTIALTDAEGATADPNTNVSVSSITVNRAPFLSFIHQTFTISDMENTNLATPFGYLALNELNANDILTVTIQLDSAGKGALVPIQGGTYDAQTGTFTFIGTLQEARAAVASLRFNPTDRPDAASGSIEATTFSITVTDASGATASASDIATVNSVAVGYVNHAPTAPVLSGSSITDHLSAGTLVGTLSTTDPDGDPLTVTFDWAMPYTNGLVSADGRFKIVDGTIRVNAPLMLQVDQDSTFTYTVTATDGHGGTTSSSLTIDVGDVNHLPTAPVLLGGAVSEASAARVTVGTLSSTDADNDPLDYTFSNALGGTNGHVSADGRFEIVNGTIQVRDPSLIQVNHDTTFTYGVYASDGYGGKIPSSVSITVTNVNQAPTDLRLSNSSVAEHTRVGQTIGLINVTDGDQDTITYTLVDDGGGRVELVNNELRVKDNAKIDYEQLTSFKVTIAANDGTASISKTFTLSVTDVNPENVTGTAAADLIRAGSGTDTLSGGAGNDTLSGGAGSDRLAGGLGSDVFLFDTAPASTAADLIQDFSLADNDHIYLSRTAFAGFGPTDIGKLKTTAFVLGTVAKELDDRIIYDQTSGKIFYDADGTGAAAQILIATLTNSGTKPALTNAAFYII